MITTTKTSTIAVMIIIKTTILIIDSTVRGKRKPNVGPLHYIKELWNGYKIKILLVRPRSTVCLAGSLLFGFHLTALLLHSFTAVPRLVTQLSSQRREGTLRDWKEYKNCWQGEYSYTGAAAWYTISSCLWKKVIETPEMVGKVRKRTS